MRVFLMFFGACAFVVATLVVAEGMLRISERLFDDPRAVAAREELHTVVARIHTLWFRTAGTDVDPFIPPFDVFSNTGFDDPERLLFVTRASRLMPSGEWQSYDFLQDPIKAASTTYRIRSNSLGFRGREYPVEKPNDVTRVVVLGSYQAFGLGVEDDETYPAQLEATLNTALPGHFEVWNGGRAAGTAIVGLARMDEVLQYEPDLIILDYGFVDTLVYGDNIFPLAMRFPDSFLVRMARVIMQPALYVFDHSRLSSRLFRFFARGKANEERIMQFSAVMERTIERAQEKGIPIILVRQMVTLPPSLYEALERPGVEFIDVEAVFTSASSTLPHPDAWRSGYYADTWLGELDPDVVAYAPQQFRFAEFRLNLYQLNSRGQRVLAEALAPVVLQLIER